jgi:hypothetical protein
MQKKDNQKKPKKSHLHSSKHSNSIKVSEQGDHRVGAIAVIAAALDTPIIIRIIMKDAVVLVGAKDAGVVKDAVVVKGAAVVNDAGVDGVVDEVAVVEENRATVLLAAVVQRLVRVHQAIKRRFLRLVLVAPRTKRKQRRSTRRFQPIKSLRLPQFRYDFYDVTTWS